MLLGAAPAAAAGQVVVGSAPRERAHRGGLGYDGGRVRGAAEEARFEVLGGGGQNTIRLNVR